MNVNKFRVHNVNVQMAVGTIYYCLFFMLQLYFFPVRASLTIEMPSSSFCELDAIDKCKEDECVRYDAYVQKNAPTIFTIYAQGRVNGLNNE